MSGIAPPFENRPVLLVIGLVALILWAVGFFAFPVVGAMVHLLLVISVLSILLHVIRGNRFRVQ